MTPPARWVAYGRFAALSAAVAALLAAVGWVPTRWLMGGESAEAAAAGRAMLAGCAIGLVGSLLGGLPVILGGGRTAPVFRALAGTAIRLAATAALAAGAALSGRVAVVPLVAWTAISYLVLLAVDTRYALAAVRREAGPAGATETKDGEGREELQR